MPNRACNAGSKMLLSDSRLIGPEVRKRRRVMEIPLTRAIDVLDISRSTYIRFEKGSHDIRMSQLIELGSLLGLKIELAVKNISDFES